MSAFLLRLPQADGAHHREKEAWEELGKLYKDPCMGPFGRPARSPWTCMAWNMQQTAEPPHANKSVH